MNPAKGVHSRLQKHGDRDPYPMSAIHVKPVAFLAIAILVGLPLAAQTSEPLPPINAPASDAWFPGKFVWADLFTPDQDAARNFYTGLFGWSAEPVERSTSSGTHTYIILSNQGRAIGGIARRPARMADQVHGRWVGYVSVPDVAKALAAAVSLGGRELFPAKNLPDRGTQAIFVDGEGAMLGLIHSSSGDPGEYLPDSGDWTWAELFARDPAKAAGYYHSVIGCDALPDARDGSDSASFILTSGGYARASLAPMPQRPKAHPAWLFFVRVADVQGAAARAVLLGGRVLVPPSPAPSEYWRAIIADPTGAVLGLVQLEEPGLASERP
jgi:predicted enzyme related to lactoylglutathione lyase